LRPKSRLYVRLLIMTGARSSEAAGIAVGEVDLLRQQWRIPPDRAKNHNAITLSLHALLCSELAGVWPQGQPRIGYRLLGSVPGSGLQSPSKIKAAIDRRIPELPNWCWHDLRRSMRSGMARLGIDPDLAELCLNHRSHRPALAWVYDRHDYTEAILAAVTTWQDHIATRVISENLTQPLGVTATRDNLWPRPQRGGRTIGLRMGRPALDDTELVDAALQLLRRARRYNPATRRWAIREVAEDFKKSRNCDAKTLRQRLSAALPQADADLRRRAQAKGHIKLFNARALIG
jgi:hypothetical protein